MDGPHRDPQVAEVAGEPVAGEAGAHEHQRATMVPGQLRSHLHLVHLVHLEEPVLHGVDGGRVGVDLVADRVVHVGAHQRPHLPVERGREQHRLVPGGNGPHDPPHLGQEPHVGHLIGLVDGHHRHPVELDGAALDEVDEAPRGGDDDPGATRQAVDLLLHRRSAVYGHDGEAANRRQRRQDLGHLVGQLAGGDQHQPGRPRPVGRFQHLDHGQAEGEGLAGTGARPAAHVAPGEDVGDGHALDGEGLVDPALLEQGVEVLGHAQRGETVVSHAVGPGPEREEETR